MSLYTGPPASPLRAAAYLGLSLIVGIALVNGHLGVALQVFGWCLIGIAGLLFIMTMLAWLIGLANFRKAETKMRGTSDQSLKGHDA
jgi:hypothetical protein